jgi:TIR domain
VNPVGYSARDAGIHRRHYELFLSHSHADSDLVEAIARQLEQLGLSCFLDRWEMVPGASTVVGLEEALAASDAVAVIVTEHGMGRWHAEEARQALTQAIDHGTRAFVVWMPGCDPDPPGLSRWLKSRTHVDLRGKVEDGRVLREGLIPLVAGALGLSPRHAATWLDERLTRGPAGDTAAPGEGR